MCLEIAKKFKTKEAAKRKVVYKVLCVLHDGRIFNIYTNAFTTEFFQGQTAVSNRTPVSTNKEERKGLRIHRGFHCFTTLKAIRSEWIYWKQHSDRNINHINYDCTYEVFRCAVSPKDHVADGEFEGNASAVYHRITPIKRVSYANLIRACAVE